MSDQTNGGGPHVQSAFLFTLNDDSGQPNLVIDSSERLALTWTLSNPASDPDYKLVVTPFASGQVGPAQFHFQLGFDPGALTVEPALQGWDVAVARYPDGQTIQFVYVAYPGQADLVIDGNSSRGWTLSYVKAVQSNKNDAQVHVTLTAGEKVTLHGQSIKGREYDADLTLIKSNVPASAAPPISVDFVGRRSVLNDGKTPNSLTFALTNMMAGSISLSPVGATKFTVWFDAAPDWYQAAPKLVPQPDFAKWAASDVQSIDGIELHPPSDWNQVRNLVDASRTESLGGPGLTVSPQWTLTVTKAFDLQPQQPVLFTFTGLMSGLAPGIARMYLRYESLPGFRDGVLIAELEKTPLIPGPDQGQGLYLSLGTPTQDAPPAPKFDGGLYIDQLGEGPAATFANRSGGHAWQMIPAGPKNLAGAGKLLIQVDGAAAPVASFQSDGPGPRLGIGTAKPDETLHVNGTLRIDGSRTYLNGFDSSSYHWIRKAGGDESESVFIALGIDAAAKAQTVHLKPGAGHGLTVWKDGRVGIDQNNPTAKLEIAVVEAEKTDLLRVRKGTTDYLRILNDGRTGIGAESPTAKLGITIAASDTTTDVLSVYKGSSSYLTIKNDGKVFIGTDATPTSLDVSGTGRFSGNLTVNGSLFVQDGNGKRGAAFVGALSVHSLTFDNPAASIAAVAYNEWGIPITYLQISGVANGDGPKQTRIDGDLLVDGTIRIKHGQLLWWPTEKDWFRKLTENTTKRWATWDDTPSDLRLKSDVRRIPSAIDKVRRLQGVTYRWNEDALRHFTQDIESTYSVGPHATEAENQAVWQTERENRYASLGGTNVGVLAQDVEAVLPEAVTTDESGYKSVRYHYLTALLIEAIKEQEQTIEDHARRFAKQQAVIERLTHI
jgi:hypothetical protein